MSEAHLAKHRTRLLVLKKLLTGAKHYDALSALRLAKKYTVGFRKDGVTPSFDHQVSTALHALTLPEVMFPEELIATIMTHDLGEDYGLSPQEIRSIFRNQELAERVAGATDRLTKVWRGMKRNESELFGQMAEDPVASIAKGLDRVNNHNGMAGVFTSAKVAEYIMETEERILPMLKAAKENFPHQTTAYENLSWTLKAQIGLIRGFSPEVTEVMV